jgi:hypothetical protein
MAVNELHHQEDGEELLLMRKIVIATLLSLWSTQLLAQTAAPTQPLPQLITTGLTYQQLLPAGEKKSITIQNNNATDSCYVIVGLPFIAGDTTASSRSVAGVTITAIKASILLLPGAAYTRYYPDIPNDVIIGTCTTTADSIYVDRQ